MVRGVSFSIYLQKYDTCFNENVIFSTFFDSLSSLSLSAGNILGATELQGPNVYSYKDLKTATNNFSEENKLGQGGFGDVYKVKFLSF